MVISTQDWDGNISTTWHCNWQQFNWVKEVGNTASIQWSLIVCFDEMFTSQVRILKGEYIVIAVILKVMAISRSRLFIVKVISRLSWRCLFTVYFKCLFFLSMPLYYVDGEISIEIYSCYNIQCQGGIFGGTGFQMSKWVSPHWSFPLGIHENKL